MKISLVHMRVRRSLKENLEAASNGILKAAGQKSKLIALPEYFSVPDSMEEFISAEEISQKTYEETIDFLSETSKTIPESYLLGGTVVEESKGKFFNTSTLWKNGALIGKYRKKNLIKLEVKTGFSSGNEPSVFSIIYCKVGLLVCADMFDSDIIQRTVDLGAEIIFLPVAALGAHPKVKGHPLTQRIASENGVYLIKIGNVRSNTRGGRSAVIAPWGIIKEVSDTIDDSLITTDIDLQRLRNFRKNLSKTSSNNL